MVIGGVIYGLLYFFVIGNRTNYTSGPSSQDQTTVTGSTMTPSPDLPTSTSQSIAAQEINVSGNEFAFNPSTITVKKAQLTQITFTNTGKNPHDFVISSLDIRTKVIQPGESDIIQFTSNSIGSFPIVCTLPNHADRGMTGMLIVQ